MLRKIFAKKIILLIILATTSCVSEVKDVNFNFQKKFSEQVAAINSSRVENNPQINSQNPDQSTKQVFLDQQSLINARNAAKNKLPEDMFDITYNTELAPPFINSGVEFDAIKIPKRDRHGVLSTLNDKQYLLAGNQSLQKNIDRLINSQTSEEIEISEIIIKEQKELKKKQKLAKLFGDNYDSIENAEIDDSAKEKIEIAAKTTNNDSDLQKAIALQVIQQNIMQNKNKAQTQK